MERSLVWYRRHQAVAGALFWLPTIFLYLISRFGIADALRLQAVYYLAVVVIEVPSGWFSDRFGRVLTLRMVAGCWIVAHGLLVVDPGVVGVALAQVLLAAGYALISGTDVTLHFETLESLGRTEEYSSREALVRRRALMATGASAVVGGALGMVDLRLPFVAALVAAVVQLGCAARLREPPRSGESRGWGGGEGGGVDRTGGLLADLTDLRHRYREPILAWVTLAVAAQVVVVHLADELGAPYLTAVVGTDPASPDEASLANGLVAAAVAGVAALGLRVLGPLTRRFGLRATLIAVALVPVSILGAMSAVTTLLLVPLIALRGLHGAANAVIVPAIVGGRVPSHQRATFLSVASLSGRLGYALVLGAMSGWVGEGAETLRLAAAIGLGAWLLMTVTAHLVPDFPREAEHDHEHEHDAVTHDHFHTHDAWHHGHDHAPLGLDGYGGKGHSHTHHHQPVRHHHPHGRDLHHDHPHR